MRLIDADALIEELGMARECKNCPFCKDGIYCRQSQQMVDVCEAIDDMPTIDPVKHGMWKDKVIYTNVLEPTGAYYHECSDCGFKIGNSDKRLWWKYCPKCGARMDGEGSE